MVPIGIILGLAAAICWGVGDYFAKIAVTREKNFIPLHIEMVTNLAITSAYLLFFPPLPNAFLIIVPQMVFVSFFFVSGWWLFLHSLKTAKLSIQGPASATYGLITLATGLLILNESPSMIQVAGALLVVAGAVSISISRNAIRKFSFNREVLLAFGASLCWGVAFTLLPICSEGFPAAVSLRSSVFFSTIFGFGFVLLSGKKLIPSKKSYILPPMFIGAFDFLASMAYYTAAAFFFTSLLAPIASIYPVFAILLAYLFLNERLKRFQLLSIAGILAGIILISI